jgi:hypothetical protein
MQRLLNQCMIGMLISFLMSTFSFAQDIEIEILNQNGDKVGAQEIAPAETDNALIDDNVTIISPDGSSKKLNLNGNQSIIIRRSMKTVDENGQRKTESNGKAVIIGPDGQRQEFELNGESDLGLRGFLGLGGFPGQGTAVKAGKFMIGVHCDKIHPAVAAQLDLESGMGLLVKQVSKDSPAANAGIQKHDVLLFADDKQLSATGDLIKAVQSSGEGETAVSITLIHRGKESTVKVKPIERPASAINGMEFLPNNLNFQFREFGPGAVIDIDPNSSFDQRIERMQEQMQRFEQRIQQQMQEALSQQNFQFKPSDDED